MSAMNREVGGDEEGYEGAKKKRDSPLKDYVFYYENMIIDDNNLKIHAQQRHVDLIFKKIQFIIIWNKS